MPTPKLYMYDRFKMDITAGKGSGSTSGAAILGALIPTLVTAVVQISIFLVIRNRNRKQYAPRTFLGTIPEKDRTPSHAAGIAWFRDYRGLSDRFVLQHNSPDAYLFLRFLKFIVLICFVGVCLTWPILIPINATGGGNATQLDKISYSNIAKNDHIWAHVVVAWLFFGGIFAAIAYERLQLIGIRQACFLNKTHASRLSARTVLFLNVPKDAMKGENLKRVFGEHAERSWPSTDCGDLNDLVKKRNDVAFELEGAEMDLIMKAAKRHRKLQRHGQVTNTSSSAESQSIVPDTQRPKKKQPPLIGLKVDTIGASRKELVDLNLKITQQRSEPSRPLPGQSAVFVAFTSQEAAHQAFQQITFQPRIPLEDRFLAVQPKEVLWENLAMPVPKRLSKASFALLFVIVFTIFFSIPTGLIGTLSNIEALSDRVSWLSWLQNLPPYVIGLLTGLLPPFLTSWFVSYVPKLFRHIAKLSGEPTLAQAELKTQAWYFAFQVFQIFLVATFSSGAAAVVAKITQDPGSAPALLASSLPKASNFYLTYFILQGLASAAKNVLNYSDLVEYWFYEYFWDKTPRQKFSTYAQMKGTPWAAWYPKFTNLIIIAVAYSCIAPLILGFATIGIFLYYLAYRYDMLYTRQTKIDTKGEAYKRALQQMPTGLYLAQLCLIGLFAARKASAQTALMIVLLVITAIVNLLLDRMLHPLELYLGLDKWREQEVPLLAEQDGIPEDDEAALHAASHSRRLGIRRLPDPGPRWISDFCDSIITSARSKVEIWLEEPQAGDDPTELSEEDIKKAYLNPVLTSKMPKLWIPKDQAGASKQEVEQNEAEGIDATDDGADIDEHGKLRWNHHFEEVPIYSKPKVI